MTAQEKLIEDAQEAVWEAIGIDNAVPCPIHHEHTEDCGGGLRADVLVNAYLDQTHELVCAGEVEAARIFLRERAVQTFKRVTHGLEYVSAFERVADTPDLEKLFHSSGAIQKIFTEEKIN